MTNKHDANLIRKPLGNLVIVGEDFRHVRWTSG
jgi:hypothetical protein